MNHDSGWRPVAEGHGVMAAILDESYAEALAVWDAMAIALGHSAEEARAWWPTIGDAYRWKLADLAASKVEVGARDPIHRLCSLVKEAGLTMTLYGRPVDEGTLRSAAMLSGLARVTGQDQEQIVHAALDEAGIPVAPSPPERKETDHADRAPLQPAHTGRG